MASKARWLLLIAFSVGCASVDPQAPLGSVSNPVRADTFVGEYEYFSRLRCTDGTRPHLQRLQRRPRGPYGRGLSGYRVRCIYLNEEQTVFFDSHHPDHVESVAVSGFSLASSSNRRPLLWLDGEDVPTP